MTELQIFHSSQRYFQESNSNTTDHTTLFLEIAFLNGRNIVQLRSEGQNTMGEL